MSDQPDFFTFAHQRLNAPVYDPGDRTLETQAFVIAQQSAQQLMGWADGLTNARGETLTVRTGFIERMTPNALADRYRDIHYIGMHQALLVSLTEFALFAFTQRDVFPQIGNAPQEESPELRDGNAPGILLLNRTLSGKSIRSEFDRLRVPKDEHRHAAAIYLAMLMARFVWLHELAHCTNGHVAYVQNAGLALRLYEVAEELAITRFKDSQPRNEQQDQILRQLEYDADSTAFFGCCSIQLNDLENIDGIKALDIRTRLGMSIFAAYATTWLFEEYQNFIDTRSGTSHPAPHARLQNLTRVAEHGIAPKVDGFEGL